MSSRAPVLARFSSNAPETRQAYLDHRSGEVSRSRNKGHVGLRPLDLVGPLEQELPTATVTGSGNMAGHPALGVALAACTDPTITTEALRVYLGIAETVWTRRTKADKVAYLGDAHLVILSGIEPRTLAGPRKEQHLGSLARLGLVQAAPGQRGKISDGHGLASAWDSCTSEFEPTQVEHPEALARFTDPASHLWTSAAAASSGWRLALVCVALHGLTKAPLRLCDLAEVLGVQPPAVSKALARLARWGLVAKEGRRWVWDPEWLVLEIEHPDAFTPYLLDNRPLTKRLVRGHRRPWLEQRDRWVTAKRAQRPAYGRPMPYPPEPPLLSNPGRGLLSNEEDDPWHSAA